MGNTIYDLFAEDVDRIIELNKLFRKQFTKHVDSMGTISFAYEFCTVQVNAGRQTGKTSYIASRARPGDLVVVANTAMKKHFRDYYALQDGIEVFTADDVDKMDSPITRALRINQTVNFKNVYVDEPKLVFAGVMQHVFYKNLTNEDDETTFVMLGR